LQLFGDHSGLRVSVCHLPPGTSKWNEIEHRMFCHIIANCGGKPLESHQIIVSPIDSTTTSKGLRIEPCLDSGNHLTGVKVSDAEMAEIRLEREEFRREWNDTILPHGPVQRKGTRNSKTWNSFFRTMLAPGLVPVGAARFTRTARRGPDPSLGAARIPSPRSARAGSRFVLLAGLRLMRDAADRACQSSTADRSRSTRN
jgi:Rhodopirellula transposase DDE domain